MKVERKEYFDTLIDCFESYPAIKIIVGSVSLLICFSFLVFLY